MCTVSRQFVRRTRPLAILISQYGPARRQLHRDVSLVEARQCDGLLAGFEADEGGRLASAVQRLHLRIGCGEGAVTSDTAIAVLAWTHNVRTIAIASTASLSEEVLRALTGLPLVVRAELACAPLQIGQLATVLTSWPLLVALKVDGLASASAKAEIEVDTLPALMRLRELELTSTKLSEFDFVELLRPSTQTLRILTIRSTKSITRRALQHALSFVGSGLRALELRGMDMADDTPELGRFMDRVASYCPFLTDFSIASDRCCSSAIVSSSLASLPLRHLELDVRLPWLEPAALVDALERLPSGRLESLLIGPLVRWHDDDLARVARVCDRQGVYFSRKAADEGSDDEAGAAMDG